MTPERYQKILHWLNAHPAAKRLVILLNHWLPVVPFVCYPVLLVLLNMVLMGLATLLTLMLAVTIGATAAKKHPILLAIAVYYGLSLVRMAACLNAANACTSSGATLAALAGVNAAAMLIAYFWMYYLTSRKLNLS